MSNSNVATIFVYKSTRKNAKCEMYQLFQWNGAGCNCTVPYNLVSIIERVLIATKEYGVNVLKSYVTTNREVMIKNASGNFVMVPQFIGYNSAQVQFYSCEMVINWLYNIWMQVQPDATLALDDLYKDASIKHFISRFYANIAVEVLECL